MRMIPEGWTPNMDGEDVICWDGPSIVVGEGFNVTLEYTHEHGIRCCTGNEYITPQDLREIRDKLIHMCDVFHD